MFSNQTLQKPLNENIMDKAKSGTVIKDNAPLYMQSLKEKSGLDNNEIQIALDEKERQVSDDIMKDPPSKSEYDDIQEEITMQAYNQVKDDFENGRITAYSCGGFPTEEEGRKYIEENILFHHETLPMSECAIGTNTTACAEASRLGILERLPILIAEKTGPHFAVGDTCYSHEEENRVFNPDGKEIFAKENEYSLMRDTDPENAYFGCHTDITIPYEEVGLLAAVRADGAQIPVIRDGRFVLKGTDFLNKPLIVTCT